MVKEIYLDHAATTPLRPEVREAMLAVWAEVGNPSSAHRWGRRAWGRLEEARERLATILGARRSEIVFTGSGTEADNLAVLGRWRAVRQGAVVCSAVEHRAVLGPVEAAGREGATVVVLGVDGAGRLDLGALSEALSAHPAVVSVMWGNNEVGTLQPVAELAARCHEAGVAFHTDAVQAFGRERVRVDELPLALLSVSAHKLGGPAGVGALFVRDGVELEPLAYGGGQEEGLRPGTEPVAAAVGLAVAAELAEQEREAEHARLEALRDRLEAGLLAHLPGLVINGAGAPRLPHILSISIPGVDREALLLSLDMEGLAVSSGSACRSGALEPSHVLIAMGEAAPGLAPIRFSLGRTTTVPEIEEAGTRFARVAERLRALAEASR